MNIKKFLVGVFLFVLFFAFSPPVFSQSSGTSLSYNFNDGNTDAWTLGCSLHTPWVCGNWRVEDGALLQDTGADDVVALIKDSQFGYQTIETQVKLGNPSGYGGVIFWQKDIYNQVVVELYPAAGFVIVRQDVNGSPTNYLYTDNNLSNSTWYNLKVEANSINGNLNVYLDGNYLFSYATTTQNRSGNSGVVNGNAGGSFDNFSLTTPATVGANLSAYVQPTGSDCNINVPSQYSTIQAGIDAATDGQTVCVGPGIYNENVIIVKPITLAGSGASESIINGQITNDVPGYYTILIGNANVDHTIVEGFRLVGVGHANDATVLLTDSSVTNVKIQYNWIVAGNNEKAVREDGAPVNVLVQNNVLEGNNFSQTAQVSNGDSNNFLNNTFIGSVSVALYVGSTNSLIEQNSFHIGGGSLVIRTFSTTTVVNENNLNGNVNNIDSPPNGTLNAENNWWGDTDPSNNIGGDVDYSNFALMPFPEYPIPSPPPTPTPTPTATPTPTPTPTATPTPTPTPTPIPQLSELSPAKVWIGLKNGDDVGLKFDLKVEAYKDSTLVSSGELDSFTGGSSGFNNAHLATIPFNSFSPIDFIPGSQLKLVAYVRNACTGSGHNSGTARLWYNDSAANSMFGSTIGTSSYNDYLLDNFILGTSVGGGPKKTVDVAAGARCSAFKTFGTWTITP